MENYLMCIIQIQTFNISPFKCFSLEAVKTLQKLMETDMSTNPLQTYGDTASLCADPDLPGESRVLCEKDDADVFQRLGCERLELCSSRQ
uniref:Si:ch211-220m17.4 n=1 Tax=Sinocyclocheilus grahami TaxID=75366 RepID=A0A672T5V6_SINGR